MLQIRGLDDFRFFAEKTSEFVDHRVDIAFQHATGGALDGKAE